MNPRTKPLSKRYQTIRVLFPTADFRLPVPVLAAEEARRRLMEHRKPAAIIAEPVESPITEAETGTN